MINGKGEEMDKCWGTTVIYEVGKWASKKQMRKWLLRQKEQNKTDWIPGRKNYQEGRREE